MHTDLAPHLHSKECNELINLLQNCHIDNPLRKFFGYCNDFDRKVVTCLKNERLARRQRNYEKSLEIKRKIRMITQQTKS
ncbi:hypothetical protein RN001_016113 [Aquatica leii]|uniref:COX assembly mitochondrial protein n=1 Tax=Aquatica leii TaxID=1421715 RepID=A0AAN7NXK2_9COLE|nr:hypothetical protein RN001_016113 [Aquatica leii]